MAYDLVIRGGKVYLDGDFHLADIALSDGKIASISSSSIPQGQGRSIDATEKLVIPGRIDTHVHIGEPGDIFYEDFRTGARAAAAGGVTTIFEMPTSVPPMISTQTLENRIKLAKKVDS